MTKFYLFRIQIIAVMIILVSVWSGAQLAHAQTPSSETPPAAEPQTQTLMQDTPAMPQADLTTSAATNGSVPSANSAPPSLSDYLNNAGVAAPPGTSSTTPPQTGAQTGATGDTATVTIPTLDMNALGGPNGAPAQPQEDSPEVMKEKAAKAVRKDAFDATVNQMMPLKPTEIRRFLELYDETKQASETPVYSAPEPESTFTTISLDPGAKPQVIKTAVGNVTTLSIVDLTGQPWPIDDLTWAGDFDIEKPDSGGHMLRIIPTSDFATGNVSMRLVGLNPPVIFSLRTERKTVHVRLDVQIPEIGPNGIVPPIETTVSTKAGDDFMTSVLVGVVKGGDAAAMKVDGIDGRTTAYSKGGMMYVRTPYTMLSPAWTSSVQSGDGMKVYALNFSPVILLSDKGKMVRAYLSRKEIVDEQY